MMRTEPTILELGMDKLDDILRRAETKHLNAEDRETIRMLFQSYVHLLELLKDKNTSIGLGLLNSPDRSTGAGRQGWPPDR